MGKLIIQNRYATIPVDLLNNTNISLKAKGLFAFLQSKPDGWNFSKDRISKQLKEGISSIKSAFKELKNYGYLRTLPTKRDEDGKFIGYDYILYDKPYNREGGKTESTKTVPSDNHTSFSNINNSNKDIVKKNIYNSEQSSQIHEIFEIFYNSINRNINFGNKTQRKAVEDMIRINGFDNVKKITELACQFYGEPYCPVITTPIQLKNKWSQFGAWIKQNSNNGITII